MPILHPAATLTRAAPAAAAAARTLRQPGTPAAWRINSRQAPRARHLRLQLPAGATLFDALVEPLAALGIRHAAVTLLGGWLDAAQYCVSVPDPAGRALLTHSAPISAGRVCLAAANATLAQGIDGQPLLHCHAALFSEIADMRNAGGGGVRGGVRGEMGGAMNGGHLLAQHCTVGPGGITARVVVFDGFTLRAAFDDETQLPLVQPHD